MADTARAVYAADVDRQPLPELVAPDWAQALAPVADDLADLGTMLREEVAAGHRYLPEPDAILRAFTTPMADVRVLVVGQDPYPTPGHATGLAFSVRRDVRPLPRSLANIYRELHDDLGIAPASHGDLAAWADQGVLLLNRTLTVRAGDAGSHRGRGWESVTARAIEALVERGGPLVAVLWGRHAQTLAPMLGDTPVVTGAHPSPLSASRGFFGSRPFSQVNELLVSQGAPTIDWTVTA